MGQGQIQTAQSGDITVRRAHRGERAQIHGVFYRSIREGAGAFYTEAQRAVWAPDPAPAADEFPADERRMFWVAEHGGQIIGVLALEPEGYLDLAFVLPEWMGRGVTQMIYAPLLQWAKEAGLKRLTTHASHFARRFFEKQGWQVDSPETVTRDGQDLERFCMSLKLMRSN